MSMSQVIQGNIRSLEWFPYLWNYSRDHSDDISYRVKLVPVKSRSGRWTSKEEREVFRWREREGRVDG
jgi:hypothetical protein